MCGYLSDWLSVQTPRAARELAGLLLCNITQQPMACRSLLQVWFLSLIRFVNPHLTSFCVQQSATALQLMMDALCASEDAEAADPLALVLMNATQACPRIPPSSH
jgi:hypothetical protein